MPFRFMTPRLSIIAAVADNHVIGKGLDMPWHIGSDLKEFKALTMGKPIIMGSNTWDSLPKKPLPGRLNIVLSRDLKFQSDEMSSGCIICTSIFDALQIAREHAIEEACSDICIIGGAKLYEQFLPLADRLYISHVHASPQGDIVFPTIDPKQWLEISCEFQPRQDGDDFDYTRKVYDRIKI